MSFMWHAETFDAATRPIAVAQPVAAIAESGDRRLRAQVWGMLLGANLVASIALLWLIGAAIL